MSRISLIARLREFLVPTAASPGIVAQAPPVALREIFRRFWPFARPYRFWLLGSLVFVALGPLVELAGIWLFKQAVDRVFVPHDFGPLPMILLAYLGLAVVEGVTSFFDRYLPDWVGERFLLDLRTSCFRHLQGLSLPFFERRQLGDLLSRLTGDIAAIESFMLSGVADGISYLVRMVLFAGALILLRWDLALVSLVVIPLFSGLAARFSRRIKQASRERRRRSGSISAAAEESLANVHLVQAYNRQGTEVARFADQNQGAFAATMAASRLRAAFSPLAGLVELIGVLAVITMGTWELAHGRLTLGGLLAFLTVLLRLYSPIRGVTGLVNSYYSASASAERVIELLDEQPAVSDPPQPLALTRARGAIELCDVFFRYPVTPSPALQGVSLRVAPGETLALVGPSGSGKSTIAKLLLRFYDPTDGEVLLDGIDLRQLAVAEVRENIAVVLQDTLVFDATIRDNILYGRPDASEHEVEEAARAAEAHDFIIRLTDGYDTQVGQKGRRLSGGQRQRIAIARAIIRDAPLLVLDEPTTGLDQETGWRLRGALTRLMAGRTTVIISHSLLMVHDATQIAMLDHGRIVEHGSHAELLARQGAYARLHNLQATGHRDLDWIPAQETAA